jgi:hypothetical protein
LDDSGEKESFVAYKPHPIPTGDVELDAGILELTELLARNAHEIWARQRMAEGWRYGPERNDVAREHPCLISYDDLPESEKEYDRNLSTETLKVIRALGYRIEKPAGGASEPRRVSKEDGEVECMSDDLSLSQKLDLFRLPPEFAYSQDLLAKAEAEARIKKILDEFKSDVEEAHRSLKEKVRQSADYLIPPMEQPSLPSRARAILHRYAAVDALAIHYRDLTNRTFIRLLAIVFSAMMVLEIFAHIIPDFISPVGHWPRMVIWLYPILWGCAYILWRHAHHKEYQKKHNDYRALAEALRVQFFWDLLGLTDSVEKYYLNKQQGELEWICCALRFWHDQDQSSPHDVDLRPEKEKELKNLVSRLWIRSQLDYFKHVAGPREKRRSDRSKGWGTILLGLSMIFSLALAFNETWYMWNPSSDPDLPLPHQEAVFIFFLGIFLTGAALVIAYGEKMAFLEHVRQYDVASKRFADSDKKLSSGPVTPEEMEELKNLGKDALQENGDWLLLHRDRPLEVIVP